MGEAYPEKKNAIASHPNPNPNPNPNPKSCALRLSVRAPRAVDLEVALLAERRVRGRDWQRMRFAAIGLVLARRAPWTYGHANPCWRMWLRRRVRALH